CRRPAQRCTERSIFVINCLTTATKTQRTTDFITIRISNRFISGVGLQLVVHTATHRQTQYIINQQTRGCEIGGNIITVRIIAPKGTTMSTRSAPLIATGLGTSVDYSTDGISTVQG